MSLPLVASMILYSVSTSVLTPFFSYDHRNVPDTMNVHGIYETSAFMLIFENSSENQTYLEHQAGVSESSLGFMSGVKKAWGGSMQTSTQQYMAALYVDVER